jgi:hypothetical protein
VQHIPAAIQREAELSAQRSAEQIQKAWDEHLRALQNGQPMEPGAFGDEGEPEAYAHVESEVERDTAEQPADDSE